MFLHVPHLWKTPPTVLQLLCALTPGLVLQFPLPLVWLLQVSLDVSKQKPAGFKGPVADPAPEESWSTSCLWFQSV